MGVRAEEEEPGAPAGDPSKKEVCVAMCNCIAQRRYVLICLLFKK